MYPILRASGSSGGIPGSSKALSMAGKRKILLTMYISLVFMANVCGVDAVKGPCAVSIFSVLCVLLVIVIVNRVGGVGGWGGDVNVLCDCKVLLHFHTYVMLRYC